MSRAPTEAPQARGARSGSDQGQTGHDPEHPIPAPRRSLLANPFLWAALAAVITLPLVRILFSRVPEPPPILGALSRFSLSDQRGRPFGSAELRGRVWVANFIFTSCRSICPRLTASMRALRERYLRERIAVHSVSISVDPENDTPRVLGAYARKHGADLAHWSFLTGSPAAVRALVVGGFKTHMGARAVGSDNLIDIAHAPYFVLVDGEGNVRGYYEPTAAGLDEVFHRSQHVLREARRRGR